MTLANAYDGERSSPDAAEPSAEPLWISQLDSPAIVHDLGLGSTEVPVGGESPAAHDGVGVTTCVDHGAPSMPSERVPKFKAKVAD
jgi:hypothetical protein